jgi:hypothetical protein
MFIEGKIEVWRHGDRDLISPFHDGLNTFPVGPLAQGTTFNMHISTLYGKMKYDGNLKLMYMPHTWNEGVEKELTFEVGLRIYYNFNMLL